MTTTSADAKKTLTSTSSGRTKKEKKKDIEGRATVLTTLAASPFAAFAQEALAKDGEFGVLEGRSAALVPPDFLGHHVCHHDIRRVCGLAVEKSTNRREEIQELKKAAQIQKRQTVKQSRRTRIKRKSTS